jgi:two-component system LytT family response regulator
MNPARSPSRPGSGNTWRALLIDDEVAARDGLRWLLAAHPGHTIVGEAATFSQAQAQLARTDYELVFLDIQLVGGSGFDLVSHVRVGARIIFVTAFDRHALRAFEVNAVDYLLKPVSPERFAASLARLAQPAASPRALPMLATDDTVLVSTDAGDHFVPVAEIAVVFSNANYSDVQLRSGKRLFTRRTMKLWEELLPSAAFLRVHRHALVNLACVEEHQRVGREAFELRVIGAREPVTVSRYCVAELQERLGPGRG